jgi:hypothetical protein
VYQPDARFGAPPLEHSTFLRAAGGTALVHAVLNNDVQTAKLLLEYGADYRLFVDALGRPIYMMEISADMRRLIPQIG